VKVINYFNKSEKTHFSFEILPPLKGHTIKSIYETIDPLMEFNPININVTYHQEETVYKRHESGLLEKKTIWKRPGTVAISAAIKYKYHNVSIVPHLICGGFTKEETENALIDLHFLGMHNILALRGDPPKSERIFIPEDGGHQHTIGLIEQIMNMNKGKYLDDNLQNSDATNFCIGIAGYPEKHIEAPNLETDLKYLKDKVDAGAEYIITQMFFENKKYFEFVEKCKSVGINVPIIPGLKPIRNFNDFRLLPSIFNISFPQDLVKEITKCKTDSEVKKVGIEWSIFQSKELMKNHIPDLHFFTIGKSDNVYEIAKAIF
jgi:methylenetetrahydrofolate reductase (NADPH)